MTDTGAERVARGAALLDRAEPGWAPRIDVSRLNFNDAGSCVLGQLFRHYLHGKRALARAAPELCGLGDDTVISQHHVRTHGFLCLGEDPCGCPQLAAHWVREIAGRLT